MNKETVRDKRIQLLNKSHKFVQTYHLSITLQWETDDVISLKKLDFKQSEKRFCSYSDNPYIP